MKSRIKKLFLSMLMVFCICTIAPSVFPQMTNTVEAASIKLNKSKVTLELGKSMTLKVSGTKKKVTWSTSKKAVATVNKSGKVVANKTGTTVISAKVDKKTLKCTVVVKAPTISKKSVKLKVGSSVTLKMNGTKSKVIWSSSNKSIATVNKYGKVTAKKAGKATITATVLGRKYKCTVTVEKKPTPQKPVTPIEKPKFYAASTDISITDAETYKAAITFTGIGTIRYSISNPQIISCEWEENWNNDTINLCISGKNVGTTTVKITNSLNNEVINIKVNVVSAINIKLPMVPQTINDYMYNGRLSKSCEITNIYYDVEKLFSGYSVKIYVDGKKTFNRNGNYESSYCSIGYKIYKDGAVIESGTIYSTDVAVGETFVKCKTVEILDEPGNYELILLDVN